MRVRAILAINGMESATMAAGWALEEIGVSPVGYLEIVCLW